MSVEDKLGKSLDAIIEENRKKVTTKLKKPSSDRPKPKGIRVDGAKRRVAISGGSQRAPVQLSRRPERGGAGAGSGLGVQRAGIKKAPRPVYTYEAMDTDDDYGMGGGSRRAPRQAPRQARAPKTMYGGGGGGDYGDYGAGPRRGRGAPVPRGNPDGQWSHDLFDDHDNEPPRRMRQPGQALGGRLAGRLGGPAGAAAAKTALRVSNLDFTVTDKDILELFSTCGTVVSGKIHYDNSGRSDGFATVVYSRQEEAEAAIKEYNGVRLDGKELKIEFAPADNVMQLSSGRSVERRLERGPEGGGMGFRRAMHDAVPRNNGAGPRPVGRGPAAGGRGRLRSGVVARSMRTREELDAELDMMQE